MQGAPGSAEPPGLERPLTHFTPEEGLKELMIGE